jgi:CheY-like chemotaxis protein
LQEQLSSWKLRNESCASAGEAIVALRAAHAAGDPFHIAILDHQMPDIDGEMLGGDIKADPALHDTVLVMLTSQGHKADATRLKRAGFAAYLLKPARQSELLGTLVNVWDSHEAGQYSDGRPLSPSEPPPTQSTVAGPWTGTRVLVVEDNVVNQKVATLILQSFGCRVEVAANGHAALAMLDTLSFDLIFMDCEMPEMDGYETTAEIRRRPDDKSLLPIIAVTAKATPGDRERCLRAGMDGYVAKPIQLRELTAAIAAAAVAPGRVT